MTLHTKEQICNVTSQFLEQMLICMFEMWTKKFSQCGLYVFFFFHFMNSWVFNNKYTCMYLHTHKPCPSTYCPLQHTTRIMNMPRNCSLAIVAWTAKNIENVTKPHSTLNKDDSTIHTTVILVVFQFILETEWLNYFLCTTSISADSLLYPNWASQNGTRR